jgi:hypothetical protein
VGYTCLWVPYDPGRELLGDFADEIYQWMQDVAQENAWDLEYLDIQADYVVMTISAPQKTLPDGVIQRMMEETAQRTAAYYPDVVREAGLLWADGYYLVTPPRELTEREIARFVTYQRQAQLS